MKFLFVRKLQAARLPYSSSLFIALLLWRLASL